MRTKKYKKEIDMASVFRGLDGSLAEVSSSKLNAPDKNEYFLGFIGIALGIASIVYAVILFSDTEALFKPTTEAWIFLVLGLIFFVAGAICVLKAAVYFYTLKPFLRSAKLTKCNIKCLVEHRKAGSKNDWYYQSFYTLNIFYINDRGRQCKKVVKWLLAYKYYEKLRRDFEWDDPPFCSLYNKCIVAYNDKGKVILLNG